MARDEQVGRGAERHVPLEGVPEEAVVRGPLLGLLPGAFDRIEVGRVRRKPKELDAMTVVAQPLLALWFEVVAGPVVDDEEDLAPGVVHKLPQEIEERRPVEDVREGVPKLRFGLERQRTEHMRCLAKSEGVDVRLDSDRSPGSVETAVQPEARFVAEHHEAATGVRFF